VRGGGEDARRLAFQSRAVRSLDLMSVPALTPVETAVRTKKRPMHVGGVAREPELLHQFGAFVGDAGILRVLELPQRSGRASVEGTLVPKHPHRKRELVRG